MACSDSSRGSESLASLLKVFSGMLAAVGLLVVP
jgi:hypothetical protein